MYATVDTSDVALAVAQLKRQAKGLGVRGLKLYPAFFYAAKGFVWRLDSEDCAVPLLRAARRLGLRNVAIHKALWLQPAPREAFNIDDPANPGGALSGDHIRDRARGRRFQLEDLPTRRGLHEPVPESGDDLRLYPGQAPRMFAKVLGALRTRCGSESLMVAAGTNLAHPAPVLEAFAAHEVPEKILEEFGLRQRTNTDRHCILGVNALHGLGVSEREDLSAAGNEEFNRARQKSIPAPWSDLRQTRARMAS